MCRGKVARREGPTESMRDWKIAHCFSIVSNVVSSEDAGVGVEESMFISSSVAASARDVEVLIVVFRRACG